MRINLSIANNYWYWLYTLYMLYTLYEIKWNVNYVLKDSALYTNHWKFNGTRISLSPVRCHFIGILNWRDNDSERHVSFQGAYQLHYIGKRLYSVLKYLFGFRRRRSPLRSVNRLIRLKYDKNYHANDNIAT